MLGAADLAVPGRDAPGGEEEVLHSSFDCAFVVGVCCCKEAWICSL